MLQFYINKNKAFFIKKYILLIQKTFHYYRVYQILNGKIINYIILNDQKDEFSQMYKDITNNMNNKIDEVIFEGDYNKYQDLVDKLLKISVVLIDYIDILKIFQQNIQFVHN